MRIDREWLLPSNTPLLGFGGTKVFPVGTITLLVTIGTYPQQLTREVSYLVVDCLSAYNAIIGRPTLNTWRAATSTYHNSKVPNGVRDWRGMRGPNGCPWMLCCQARNRWSPICIEHRRKEADRRPGLLGWWHPKPNHLYRHKSRPFNSQVAYLLPK